MDLPEAHVGFLYHDLFKRAIEVWSQPERLSLAEGWNMEVAPAGVTFPYTTIVATKSRIDKGLLAIPISLVSLFPKANGIVYLLDEGRSWVRKSFTAYDSTSKECRIGGMRQFYDSYRIQSGDELVIQVHGNGRYEILPEKVFHRRVLNLESTLDNAPNQTEADAAISELAELTQTTPFDVIRSEFVRLSNQAGVRRKVAIRDHVKTRERIPPSLRNMLIGLYRGRCQVSGFSFLTTTGEPYFEVHHIDPFQGNHPKNVLVVSPNVHAQFTYAEVEHSIDEFGWLRQVKFNGRELSSISDCGPIAARLPETGPFYLRCLSANSYRASRGQHSSRKLPAGSLK